MTINVTNDKFIFFEQGIISLHFSYAGFLLELFLLLYLQHTFQGTFSGLYNVCAIVVMQLIISE